VKKKEEKHTVQEVDTSMQLPDKRSPSGPWISTN